MLIPIFSDFFFFKFPLKNKLSNIKSKIKYDEVSNWLLFFPNQIYLMKLPNDLKKYRETNRLLSMYWINAIGADAFLFDGLKFLKISRVRQIQ